MRGDCKWEDVVEAYIHFWNGRRGFNGVVCLPRLIERMSDASTVMDIATMPALLINCECCTICYSADSVPAEGERRVAIYFC